MHIFISINILFGIRHFPLLLQSSIFSPFPPLFFFPPFPSLFPLLPLSSPPSSPRAY